MNARFYVPGSYGSGDTIDLPADEAQHLTRVLRLRSDDPVRVFDGRGHEFDGVVATVSKHAATVRIAEPRLAAPEPQVTITVAHAVLKGDKMDDVVRDAVMIGAAAIQPIVTSRSEVTLATLDRGNRRERWVRVATSSAKQCGRAVVPAVLEPLSFDGLVDSLRRQTLPVPALMLVEPSATGEAESLKELDRQSPAEVTLLVGPEGGWTPEEVERGSSVCRMVTLGGRTLRADAMATVAIAALFAVWGEY